MATEVKAIHLPRQTCVKIKHIYAERSPTCEHTHMPHFLSAQMSVKCVRLHVMRAILVDFFFHRYHFSACLNVVVMTFFTSSVCRDVYRNAALGAYVFVREQKFLF